MYNETTNNTVNLHGIYLSLIDNAKNLLNVSNATTQNEINNLTITTNYIYTDLQNTKTTLQTNDQLLQNEIDNIVLAISYAGSVDALYGVSIAVEDSKIGILEYLSQIL